MLLPSLHHDIGVRLLFRAWSTFALSLNGWLGRFHGFKRQTVVISWALEALSVLLFLTLVIWVCWTFDLHKQIYVILGQHTLLNWQNQIVLIEYQIMLIYLLSLFIHFIENLVLFLNEEGSFNSVFAFLLVLIALSVILIAWDNICQLFLRYEFFERYLFDWATISDPWAGWTYARRRLFQRLKRYCLFCGILLVVSWRVLPRDALSVLRIAITRHKVVDVNIDICEVLLTLSKHF